MFSTISCNKRFHNNPQDSIVSKIEIRIARTIAPKTDLIKWGKKKHIIKHNIKRGRNVIISYKQNRELLKTAHKN